LVNLDYKLREELRLELQEIFRRREAIVVYTTTEPAEALMLGGDIVVMHEGRVIQTGRTREVYRTPATMTVAEVFSDPPINFLSGEISGGNVCIGSDICIPQAGHFSGLSDGPLRFGLRSNHLFLNRRSDADVEIPARVALSEINGSETFVHLEHHDNKLVLQETGIHNFRIGNEITVFAHPGNFYVYGPDGELAAAPGNGR
jgi:glycerol transport system ATP-binding protein